MNAPQKPEMKKVINESGIEVKPLYTAADVEASGGMAMVGEPGQYPFTVSYTHLTLPTSDLV